MNAFDGSRALARIGIATVLMAGIVAGCGSLLPAVPGPSASGAPTADLHVVNTKADPISIEVNGISIGAAHAGDVVRIPRSRLPNAPWKGRGTRRRSVHRDGAATRDRVLRPVRPGLPSGA
jgi:hypothetical protein